MGATIHIYFSPFSLFVSVYVYASVCDIVCTALLLPFVLGLCLSVFFVFFSFLLLKYFFFLIIFYFNNIISFYFILVYLLSFFFFSLLF